MGNQCEQCQAVTQGCKRQQFREQLKNRQKLDLSKAHGNNKSVSKIEAINGLRNVPLIQASRYQTQGKNKSLERNEAYKQHSLQEKGLKYIDKDQMQQSRQSNKHILQKINSLQEINSDFKFIKLPIESGVIGTIGRQKSTLQDLEKQLNDSKKSSRMHKNGNNNVHTFNNSTIHIVDSVKESRLQEQNKENTQKRKTSYIENKQKQIANNIKSQNNDFFKSKQSESRQQQPSKILKNEQIILKKTNSIEKDINEQLYESYQNSETNKFQMISNNPSKVLRQFNHQLKESNFNSKKYKQKRERNDEDHPQDDDEEIQTVKQHHFYAKPGVYFEGFISTFDKKLKNQGKIKFEQCGTQMQVNFGKGVRSDQFKNISLSFIDQSYFEGQFHNDSFTIKGFGKYVFPDGSYYVGEWLNNLPDGKGKHKFGDGSEYEGDFVQGRKEGFGKFIISDGQLVYEGNFANNVIQGEGIMQIIEPNTNKRRVYKGYFKNGKLEGDGCEVQYVNESAKFIGCFNEGKKCGKGKYFYGDGRTWQGQWKDNRQNGFGKYINIKGIASQGYWIDGIKSQNRLSVH